jgi:hypothetical protein
MRPGIRAAPTSFADECCGTLAHLIAHVGALALLAIVSLHLWDELRGKTETYLIFQHPGAGPEHAFRGAQQRESPVAERETAWSCSDAQNLPNCAARFDRALLPRCWFSCNFLVCRRIM